VRAPADAYTLLAINAINAHQKRKFYLVRGMALVAGIYRVPGHGSKPVSSDANVTEFILYA
jgi:hypothetical protein